MYQKETATPTATIAMILVARALMSGDTPSRTLEKITIGSVEAPGPVTKLASKSRAASGPTSLA